LPRTGIRLQSCYLCLPHNWDYRSAPPHQALFNKGVTARCTEFSRSSVLDLEMQLQEGWSSLWGLGSASCPPPPRTPNLVIS
jgi:hypothetical protein